MFLLWMYTDVAAVLLGVELRLVRVAWVAAVVDVLKTNRFAHVGRCCGRFPAGEQGRVAGRVDILGARVAWTMWVLFQGFGILFEGLLIRVLRVHCRHYYIWLPFSG